MGENELFLSGGEVFESLDIAQLDLLPELVDFLVTNRQRGRFYLSLILL